jgi:hypothetical protein
MDPITARRASRCPVCGGDMRRGERIASLDPLARPGQRRRWAHADCLPEEA